MGFWHFWVGSYLFNKLISFGGIFVNVDICKAFQTKQFSLDSNEY